MHVFSEWAGLCAGVGGSTSDRDDCSVDAGHGAAFHRIIAKKAQKFTQPLRWC